jgi:hypothetical protein
MDATQESKQVMVWKDTFFGLWRGTATEKANENSLYCTNGDGSQFKVLVCMWVLPSC